jgi:hypothetical protein
MIDKGGIPSIQCKMSLAELTPSRLLTVLSYNPSAQAPQKAPSSVVNDACLLVRCLTIDVLLFRAFASAGMCLPTRFLAMNIPVTIFWCEME